MTEDFVAAIVQDDDGHFVHPCCKHVPVWKDGPPAQKVPGACIKNERAHEARRTKSPAVAERWRREIEGVMG